MSGRLKAVVIGAAHVHILEVCKYVSDCEHMELAAVADAEPFDPSDLEGAKPYSRRWNFDYVRRYGATVYGDYRQMLDEIRPDLAFITTENAKHVDVFCEVAKRGIAASIEKPLARDYREALQIAKIARETGAEAFVNWPIAWRQWLYQMKAALDSGKMGKLIKVRHLAGQTGPVGPGAVHRGSGDTRAEDMTPEEKSKMWWYRAHAGGGAFLDMCCYGSMVSVWFSSEPCRSVAAVDGNFAHGFSDVEDNGAMLLRFPSSVAVVEGTWTTPALALPAGPEIYCTGGAILGERHAGGVRVKLVGLMGDITYLDPPETDPALSNMACAFSAYRLDGREMPRIVRLDENLRAMAVLDAGLRAAKSGKAEPVDAAAWGV
ncbi:MAG: Gfo/Idh/MocA family oxidoreductase [Clostridiales bacterium]|mgnify:FL=1|nr:Gfo/Idh/MocA family oxidoreductase [Clostridiales bacterium]OPZ69685.1 MAG: Inositol 2-dehydrogenase/D-chiro-inositol 3-dehydrogenase [Firmicutes bacterium ADurb.Bin467]